MKASPVVFIGCQMVSFKESPPLLGVDVGTRVDQGDEVRRISKDTLHRLGVP